jgi:DNA-binding GntR family transcriptional regulator
MQKTAAAVKKTRTEKPAKAPAENRKPARELSGDDIYERVYQAILEHRLHPGTKLGEDRLATIFSVSRARIREVLARLAHEGFVDLFPQRGAFVAKPTTEQARHVFEMRRMIEPGIVRRLINTLTPEKLARLREHQRRELDARERNDKRAVIRLSGEFHSLLAQIAGNSVLEKSMRELTTLTCLIIFLYDAPTSDTCREDEHQEIIDAIGKRDAAKAEKAMLKHLDHIEASLNLEPDAAEVDLEAVFA